MPSMTIEKKILYNVKSLHYNVGNSKGRINFDSYVQIKIDAVLS